MVSTWVFLWEIVKTIYFLENIATSDVKVGGSYMSIKG